MVSFVYEKDLWTHGFIVGGMDEVGRGAFAGPVMAAICIFDQSYISDDFLNKLVELNIKIDDSKKLTVKHREKASLWIKENCLSYGIGESSVLEINMYGIVKATQIAFRRAINRSKIKPHKLLVDAFYIPYMPGVPKRSQTPIIKGDSISFSIAAASILAKVERDRIMTNLSKHEKYHIYEWYKNKGYGTKKHRDAIYKFGPTKLHRRLFISKTISNRS